MVPNAISKYAHIVLLAMVRSHKHSQLGFKYLVLATLHTGVCTFTAGSFGKTTLLSTDICRI